MHLYEWLTVLAILVGPIAAISVQLAFERRREDRKRKLSVLDALMANRARMTALEAVNAFNRIDIVFYDDNSIRQKWAELFGELERARTLTGNEREGSWRRRDDLITELIILIANYLGYKLPHTLVKGRRYNPQAFVDEENYQDAIRKEILPLLKGEHALTVRIKSENVQLLDP